MHLIFVFVATLITSCLAWSQYNPRPYPAVLWARQARTGSNESSLQVDLGYQVYQGYNNATSGLNIWKG